MKPMNIALRISASVASSFQILALISALVSTQAFAWNAGTPGTRTKHKAAASPKAFCIPADSENTVIPASQASQTPTPNPGQTPEAVTGYPIMIQEGHGDSGVLAAELYFGAANTGRSRLAGYADVADQSAPSATDAATSNAAASSGTIDLKSTSQSPFRFELTIASTQDAQGAFDAELVDADLFTGSPLSNIAYKCWFKKL